MTNRNDCGHACCDERGDPMHDHFLSPEQCPPCRGSNPEREKAIDGICRRTGKTREQAIAFLDVLGSGLTKRGLINAKVLSEDEIAERVHTFLGGSDDSGE